MRCAFLNVPEGTCYIELIPGQWSNVNGDTDKGAFLRFLPNVASVSLAFGGGNSFSHGVYATGDLKFQLLKFTIEER